jgi:type II secretory pathway component GspD/PulD (secretin)
VALEPERKPVTIEEGLATKISLDLRGMDIVDTIKFLSMKGNLNIATSKNVSGRITLFLKDVSIGDTLELILLTNNLACQRNNNIITIMTEEEHEQIYGKKYMDKREAKTLKLQYALPTKVGTALEVLKGSLGKVIMDDATGTLILIDTPDKIAEMEQAALELDQGLVSKKLPTTTRVFELEYARAEELEPKIAEVLSEEYGSVKSDERTNRLFVQELPNKLKEIEKMVKAFDAKTREVIIEAKIVEITLDDEYAMGISWENLFTSVWKDINFVGNFPISYPSGASGQHGQFSIGTWKEGYYTDYQSADETWYDGTVDAAHSSQVLTLLDSLGKVKVVSSPHIAVCNNEEAKIMVGTKQPYATSTVAQSENTATTSWSAEFVDIGVTLTVTPTINKSGYVKIRIKPEVSTLTGWFEIQDEAGVTQIRLPEVDTSNAETEVLVKDGRTIIIGGLIKNTDYKYRKKVPLLGDIPVIGHAFGSRATGLQTKELVIFLTPRIVSGGKDQVYTYDEKKSRKPRKE